MLLPYWVHSTTIVALHSLHLESNHLAQSPHHCVSSQHTIISIISQKAEFKQSEKENNKKK